MYIFYFCDSQILFPTLAVNLPRRILIVKTCDMGCYLRKSHFRKKGLVQSIISRYSRNEINPALYRSYRFSLCKSLPHPFQTSGGTARPSDKSASKHGTDLAEKLRRIWWR